MLQVNHVSKTFGRDVKAVQDVSFEATQGSVVALLGESGCGKTTLLRLVAGFEIQDEGAIKLNDTLLSDGSKFVQPEKRGIGMVFQDYALFPHLTVFKNITFGMKGESDKKQRTAELLELVGLAGYEKRYPHELSGGQQQRIAIARALATSPQLLLLDEPFSNLDVSLKAQMRTDLKKILKKAGATAIVVTHDTADALAVADEIVVLKDGFIQQAGTPDTLFNQPKTEYVARLFGPLNVLHNAEEVLPGKGISGTIGIRPEHVSISVNSGDLTGSISACHFFGKYYEIAIKGHNFEMILHSDLPHEIGSEVNCTINATKTHSFGNH
jgi:iron(III) transport system ATP-binding protein